jgi:hypothetical protein
MISTPYYSPHQPLSLYQNPHSHSLTLTHSLASYDNPDSQWLALQFVTLVSNDNFKFIVSRKAALESGTVKNMLSGPGMWCDVALPTHPLSRPPHPHTHCHTHASTHTCASTPLLATLLGMLLKSHHTRAPRIPFIATHHGVHSHTSNVRRG